MYTITYNQTYIRTTLINTISYTPSSHCISITLQTSIEQQHIGGSNTQNRYMYIQTSQRYRSQVFFGLMQGE